MGFRSSIIECPFGTRVHGKSRWTFGKKVKLAIDTIASSSYVPIRLASGLGLLISLLSFLYGALVVLLALVRGVAVQGWPTMMAAIAFLAGLQLLVAGVMGEYLWRVLYESRGRPLYVVDETRGLSPAEAGRLGGFAASTGAVKQDVPRSDLSE
jgi:dolichol-phosphate mannosyltransferase